MTKHSTPAEEQISAAICSAITSGRSCWSGIQSFGRDDLHYRALIALFHSARSSGMSDEAIWGCASAVYEMMPCMLGHNGRSKSEKRETEIVDLQGARRFINEQNIGEESRGFINGSWVGTSKFMYFFDPKIYFIWDSRVKLAIDIKLPLNEKLNINSGNDYIKYCSSIIKCSQDEDIIRTIKKKFSGGEINVRGGAEGRLIEAALYVTGGSS